MGGHRLPVLFSILLLTGGRLGDPYYRRLFISGLLAFAPHRPVADRAFASPEMLAAMRIAQPAGR